MGKECMDLYQEGQTVKHQVYLTPDLGNFIGQLWSAPTLDIGLRTHLPGVPGCHGLPPMPPT